MTWELPAFLALVTLFVVAGRAIWILATFRGCRVISCPENRQAAAVKVDLWAALRMLYEPAHLRLANCSRWPEKRDCDQACLGEIAQDPRATRVEELIARWYADKTCVMCGRLISSRSFHQPALLEPDGRTTAEWNAHAPETLPDVLRTHRPVCWDCHMAETFRRQFPDLPIDRPPFGQKH